MDKSDHEKALSKYCRLCCGSVKVKPRKSIVYRNEILRLFNYDINNDSVIAPVENICDKCRRKLERTRSNTFNKCDMFVFPEHEDVDCKVCEKKLRLYEFSLVVKHSLSLEAIERIAQSCGYTTFQSIDNTKAKLLVSKVNMDFSNHQAYTPFTIEIDSESFVWTLFVYGKIISANHDMIAAYDNPICRETIEQMLNGISDINVCPGNNDFPDLIKNKINSGGDLNFKDSTGKTKAKIEGHNFMPITDLNTIRVLNCELIINKENLRCTQCRDYRSNSLWTMKKRMTQEPSTSKNVPNMYLSKEQLKEKTSFLQKERKELKKKVLILQAKITKLMENESIEVEVDDHNLFKEILQKADSEFGEDTPQALLWEEQKRISSLKSKKSMRWHPLLIRWCLSIYLKSPATYEHLRNGPFLELPHINTLNKYVSFTDPGSGFRKEVMERLKHNISFDKLERHEKNVALLFDEMHIKSGLVFSRSSGRLVGFTELGEVNRELEDFSIKVNQDQERQFATHVITFMVRGLFSHYNYPIGFFASDGGFGAAQLFPLVWEAVRVCELEEFHVRAFVCDGASPNRKFFKMHKLEDLSNVKDDVTYWAWNRFHPNHKIFFICDPPHLLKTIRNNVENSGANKNTRTLVMSGNRISWQHVISLYENDLGVGSYAPGLRKLPKLTHEHVYLSPRLRMRVNLATQVMSKTVVYALRSKTNPETVGTEYFFDLVDDFFDCLNVNNTWIGQKKRKENLLPYEHALDGRFKWLKDTFLQQLKDWKAEVDALPDKKPDEKSRFFLSNQTMAGIKTTVHSFVDMVQMILLEDGVKFFLSDKLNQDPLEEHFGRQRGSIGGSDNPTLEEYGLIERKLQVAKDDLIRVLRGNTRGRTFDTKDIRPSEELPLPKRKKEK